jgi:hypothetical protein
MQQRDSAEELISLSLTQPLKYESHTNNARFVSAASWTDSTYKIHQTSSPISQRRISYRP